MKNARPLTIETMPTLVNKEIVYPNKRVLILQADDKFFIRNAKASVVVGTFFGAIAIAFGIWVLSSVNFNVSEEIGADLIILAGLFFLITGLTIDKTKKKLILDRLNGTISYPDLFYLPVLKGKFNELKVVISVSGEIDGVVGREYLKFVNTFKPRKLDVLRTLTYDDPYEEWSLFVWYMDKNRPLPPGTAFDPYRQQDFEPRKAAGFPKPLYPSNIPTPEATPEQQKERKRIGGW